MAAGDVADGIGHGDDHQTERGSRQEIGRIGFRRTAERSGGAACHKDEDEGSDEFCEIFFDCLHKNASFYFMMVQAIKFIR